MIFQWSFGNASVELAARDTDADPVTLRAGTESTRTLCFGPMSHVTVRSDYARDTGLADKHVWIQVSEARVKGLMDCKPERKGKAPICTNHGIKKKRFDFRDMGGCRSK